MIPFALLFPPLAAMLAIVINKNLAWTKYIALAGTLLSFLLLPFIDNGITTIGWFSISAETLTLTASITPLSELLLLTVLVIAPLIFIYSFGFMDLPSEQKRYYLEMLAFETAMLTFAMAGNFIVLFIAWEFLSMTSYLLIGFWHWRERAIRAARKAITIILIGDMALLGSIVIFLSTFHTLEFSSIIGAIGSGSVPFSAVFLLLIAIMTKSAQFPFHEWLADAMEGPTPVSAFLHSSTMVKAGVFAAIVLFPILSAAKVLWSLEIVSGITVVIGIYNALSETHVKRVLAYSTVQELALMLFAVANNALLAAIYFFFAQSFYKALLFFSSGAAMKANEKENLNELTGLRENKIIYVTTIFGVLALAGFVPFDGFFANAGIDSAFSSNLSIYAFISLVNLATSVYIFRWLTMQSKKPANARVAFNFGTVPKPMVYAMIALAIGTLVASAAFFTVPNGLSSSIPFLSTGPTPTVDIASSGVETGLVVVGAAVGYVVYRQRKGKVVRPDEYSVDNRSIATNIANASYEHFAFFVEAVSAGFSYFDIKLNFLFDSFGSATVMSSRLARRLASGNINLYVALFAGGLIILALIIFVI